MPRHLIAQFERQLEARFRCGLARLQREGRFRKALPARRERHARRQPAPARPCARSWARSAPDGPSPGDEAKRLAPALVLHDAEGARTRKRGQLLPEGRCISRMIDAVGQPRNRGSLTFAAESASERLRDRLRPVRRIRPRLEPLQGRARILRRFDPERPRLRVSGRLGMITPRAPRFGLR